MTSAMGQVNSWLKPGSGNWEEPVWSLGNIPTNGQTILITNAGWKAVAINPNTPASSLTLASLTVASPVDSHNVLLMNYSGLNKALSIRTGTIASNSEMTMLSASLNLTGGGGEGLSIGGTFNQDQGSLVSGQQVDVGYQGPGLFNLESGTLALNHLWIGGDYHGVVNQDGGSNVTGIVHIEGPGTYNLRGGDFNSLVYFETWYPDRSLFHQTAGRVNVQLTVYEGTYWLEGGINYGGWSAPVSDGYSYPSGNATVLQTGGQNFGPVIVGTVGWGTYTLSNGFSSTATMTLGPFATYTQWGGTQNVGGTLTGGETQYARGGALATSLLGLNGGFLTASNMDLFLYRQTGGTNVTPGTLTIESSISYSLRCFLSGGLLRVNNLTTWRGFNQTGGRCEVNDTFTIGGPYGSEQIPYFGPDLVVTNGILAVSNLVLRGANASFSAGAVQQAGLLTLGTGRLLPASGSHLFGPLAIATYNGVSNSWISLPAGQGCSVRFVDSRTIAWAQNATLTITNWAGALAGGGAHRIIFGNTSGALTAQQLAMIHFSSPAGLPGATYPAKILTTGEVVPDGTATTIPSAPTIVIGRGQGSSVRLTVFGQTGSTYGIEVSSNMTTWISWTNATAANGVAAVDDTTPLNAVTRRFYRAVLNQ